MKHEKYETELSKGRLKLIVHSAALPLLFSSLPVAAQAQDTTCVLKGAGTSISIEYSSSGCRTMFREGGMNKQIAWAQSHQHVCTDVAEKVMAKSGRSAWDCDAALPSARVKMPTAQEKPHKRPLQRAIISTDYAILKSSQR